MADPNMAVPMPAGSLNRSAAAKPVLAVAGLEAWYGESHILHGINFQVNPGEVVTLLGRNGAGKTSTLKSVMGIIAKRSGSIRFDGKEIIRAASDKIARSGIAFCPEERGIFSSLNVTENLMLPRVVGPGGLDLATIYSLFPNLKDRAASQGTKLSGGEQQMLAIARALLLNPKILLLDEPSQGLAPKIVQEVFQVITTLRKEGMSILLVEQNVRAAVQIADVAFVLDDGRVVYEGPAAELAVDEERLRELAGAAASRWQRADRPPNAP